MVWAIDRLGRSIQQLVDFMNEQQWLGIDLCHQQAPNYGHSCRSNGIQHFLGSG